MKTQHIIASTGAAAIIAGTVFYLFSRNKSRAKQALAPLASHRAGEEQIRNVMHHAKEL